MTMQPEGISNGWAVAVMIAGYNRVYQAAFGTRYQLLDGAGVSYYGTAPVGAPFQLEFMAYSRHPRVVVAAARGYPVQPGETHVINHFHPQPEPEADLLAEYAALGYSLRRSEQIMALSLPAARIGFPAEAQLLETPDQLAQTNHSLAAEDEFIPPATLADGCIHNFVAHLDGQVAAWAQAVSAHPDGMYINQLYTLQPFRRRGAAGALLEAIHAFALARGLKQVVLIPSRMGAPLYARLGYQPVAYFSIFRPL